MVTSGSGLGAMLRRVRRRWFLLEWLRVFAWMALAGALAIGAVGTVHGLARPDGRELLWLSGAAFVVMLGAAALVAWPLRRRPSDRQVARYIEERCPELEDRLTSAAELLERDPAAGFEVLVLHEAAQHAAVLDLDRVVNPAALRRRGLMLAGAAVLLVMAALWWRDPIQRTWRVARYTLFPPALSLEVEPGDARIVEDGAITVRARVRGLPADWVPDPLIVRVTTGASVRRVGMTPANGGFQAEIAGLRQSAIYRVEAGALVSRHFMLSVRRRPQVASIELHYTYPPYTGLTPRIVEDEGDIFAPAGTRIGVRIRTKAPVGSGRLALAGGTRVPLEPLAPTLLQGALTVTGEDAYRVSLTDRDGLTGEGETEYFIRVIDDRPPDVRIVRPAGDRRVTRLEEIAFEARADDDYGVERLELVVSARGAEERVIPLHRSGPATTVSGGYTLYLEELDVGPGDFVSYYARARDVGRGKRPTEARSDIFFLEVRPFTEEFEAAQTQAFMSGGGGSFDDLAAQQKDVVIATWKLERRTTAGRSRSDLEAVARAQADVRARAQRLAQRLSSRLPGRPPGGEGSAETPAPGAMQLAVEAMARAQGELESEDTRGAIPHEMEALNQLLRAQADVRRRQIARQQGDSEARRGSPGHQDLSALFDRELQRQQQTNYETRSTAEQRRDASDDDPLERLRELARRQDDLSRQQQELARRHGELTPEEVRRQLERLTREQADMQRRAEALARELARAGDRSTAAQQAAQAATAQAVSEAVGEMQRAAGDLQQGRTGQAGGRGVKALERLREAERRSAAGQPDERRRAAGDLQLELYELAEAERHLSRDASRSGGQADTLRRLAGEQDGLAQRVDRLSQVARGLSAGMPEGDPLSRASRSLEGERLGERLQASSRELREAAERRGNGPNLEAAERTGVTARALADALERAADGLSPASGRDAEGRRLSERLGRARELRERLGEIARRIDELQNLERRQARGPAPDGAPGEGRPAHASASAELSRLQEEYLRRLGEAREAVADGEADVPEFATGVSSPEGWAPSRSAPGTEAFKQDFARWDELRRDVTLALERLEATLSAQLSEREAGTRLAADSDDRAPEAYRRQIARYYESITKKDRQ